jgi:membrane protein YdbS with pleckstrin-like domain
VPLQQETFNTCDNSQVSTSQISFEEQSFVLLRRHGSALILPVIVLFLDATLYFFVDWRWTESWQHQAFLAVVLIIGLLFWFIPSLKFFTNRYELTSTRAVVHSGLFGTKIDEAPWGEITGVSISRGVTSWLQGAGDIRLHREFGQDLILKRVPRAKKLSKEIEQFLGKRSRSTGVRK